MFKKILIANRGEIALRVIRACREMGVRTVIAYSEADRDSLPVLLADERVCIGPAQSSKSYLHIPNIISAAMVTHCEAIHPGYGFLAENPSFAQICGDTHLTFIGPPPEAMVIMGDKVMARDAMKRGGLPMLPGTEVLRSLGEGEEAAETIGFPLMLKAKAGGGGRGIRLVSSPEEFASVFTTAQAEVREAFQDDGLYIEKYLGKAKHVEVQVFCDNDGNGVYLGERNCSVQRRHQKLVEESPSPQLSAATREDMGRRSVEAALSIGYRGAGTMEFLVDEQGKYYFMEMNTRLQVEHPVTEMVTSTDLVQAQLLVAFGERLPWRQAAITPRGHAIEFRITAEDPDLDFRPSTGTITNYLPSSGPGVRVDSHLYTGYEVPPHYDSLLAKLIVWAPTRDEAIARGKRALGEFVVEGVPTVIPFHLRLLDHPVFKAGGAYTNFVDDYSAELLKQA
ncbi:MAG TPA: acetyl-CoA carboxylase biotin carboxylase subunit [Ktedonobacterales bacterium]